MNPPRGPLVARLTLLAVVTVTCLLAAEVGLRVLPQRWSFQPVGRVYPGQHANRPNSTFVPDTLIGWRLVPGSSVVHTSIDGVRATYQASSRGFRVPGPAGAPDAVPSSRIVLLGDSFTFGVFVDYSETFGALLEQRLPRAEVTNLAMPGFGLDQMLMTMVRHALPLHPDAVIVGFIDDDLDRSLTAYRAYEGLNKPMYIPEAGGHLRLATAHDRQNPLIAMLDAHSALWTLWRLGLRRLSYTVPTGSVWWRLNRAILDSLHATGAHAGVPVVFLRIPAPGVPDRFPVLRRHLQRRGALFLDLADPAVRLPQDVFFPRDGHLTPAGHAWVADTLAWFLARAMPDLMAAAGEQRDRPPQTSSLGNAPGSSRMP